MLTPDQERQVQKAEGAWRTASQVVHNAIRPTDTMGTREQQAWDRMQDVKFDLGLCGQPGCRAPEDTYAYCLEHRPTTGDV